MRTDRYTLWTHFGALEPPTGLVLGPVVAAMVPFSVTYSQLLVLGSRNASMTRTLVSVVNAVSPALRAGRSSPVNHLGPSLLGSGAVSPAKPWLTSAMLPVCDTYSPRSLLLSRSASTQNFCVSLVNVSSPSLRQARS